MIIQIISTPSIAPNINYYISFYSYFHSNLGNIFQRHENKLSFPYFVKNLFIKGVIIIVGKIIN